MRDKISVIMPIYNEGKIIEKTINSLQNFIADHFDLEFLLVDGMSSDSTRNIIITAAQSDSRIKLLNNPKQKTPFAMNIGLTESTGNYVAILGAHAIYQPDYLQVCFKEMHRTGASGCSGRVDVLPYNNTFTAKAAYYVSSSVFGVSGNSFRTQQEGFVDSVAYPVFSRELLLQLGGYNESLHRNQDNDMNQRIRESGHKLFCTSKTTAQYYSPPSIKALYKYGYKNGLWNAVSLFLNFKSMKLHHLIPLFFTSSILILAMAVIIGLLLKLMLLSVAGIFLLLTGMVLHLLVGFIFSFKIMLEKKDLSALLLPFIFFGFHFIYGWGTLKGLWMHRNVKSNLSTVA